MNKIPSIRTDEDAITTISTKLGLPSYQKHSKLQIVHKNKNKKWSCFKQTCQNMDENQLENKGKPK